MSIVSTTAVCLPDVLHLVVPVMLDLRKDDRGPCRFSSGDDRPSDETNHHQCSTDSLHSTMSYGVHYTSDPTRDAIPARMLASWCKVKILRAGAAASAVDRERVLIHAFDASCPKEDIVGLHSTSPSTAAPSIGWSRALGMASKHRAVPVRRPGLLPDSRCQSRSGNAGSLGSDPLPGQQMRRARFWVNLQSQNPSIIAAR